MSMLIKKRQLVMAALVVVLAAAVLVNWYYTQSPRITGDTGDTTHTGEAVLVSGETDAAQGTDSSGGEQSEYFAKIRIERTNAREAALESITAVLDGAEVSSDLAQSTALKLDDLTASIKLESDVETLVSAKLGCECVAVCSDGKMQIVVEKGVLNDGSVIQIKDIVLGNSGIPADGITILEAA